MRYVIIGTGAAGISAAKVLGEMDKKNEIIMISSDETVYSRCMLHYVIAGKRDIKSISFIEEGFFEKNDITWIKGKKVTEISPQSQEVILEDGSRISYDKLLIAAGSKASLPPIKGLSDSTNVFHLRDLTDAETILKNALTAKKALVLGAGLIGLDAASALISRGIKVTIVEMADRVLSLQLDNLAAYQYQKEIEKLGGTVYTGVSVMEAIRDENGKVKAVKLSNGLEEDCDMVVSAVGVRANTEFISSEALEINRGIRVNARMETSVHGIYAAGDVTGLSGIWPSAVKQGIVAALNMLGIEEHYSDYFTAKNSINLFGLGTVSIGVPLPPDDSFTVDLYNKDGVYKKFIHKDGIVYGAILQKDLSRSGFWTKIIKEKIKIDISKSFLDVSYADYFQEDEKGNFLYETDKVL
jgi:NAD(P)H-nitrite reductase large subunit